MNITKMPSMPNRHPLSSRVRPFTRGLSGRIALIALIAAAGVACDEKKPAPSATADARADGAAAGSASAFASPSTSPRADAGADASAGKVALRPIPESDKAAYAAYLKALGRGRELTRKKDYAGAIKAFDEALAAMHGDARATAERGYARILAKDNEGAVRDLEAARAHAPTPELEAQIWFNIGLTEEAQGHAEAARYAFTEVQSTRPSTGAAKRLIGKSMCSARIERDPKPGKTYAGWLAAWRGFASGGTAMWSDEAKPKPSTEDAAEKAICGEACKGDGPSIALVGDPAVAAEFALVVPMTSAHRKEVVVFHHLGEALGGRCGWADEVTLDPGVPLHVRVKSVPRGLELVRPDTLGELKECDNDVGECQEACFVETWTERDYFFDPAASTQLLLVEQSGRSKDNTKSDHAKYARSVGVAGKPDALYVRGGGCDMTIPLTPGGAKDGG
jgi:hypothetical protein